MSTTATKRSKFSSANQSNILCFFGGSEKRNDTPPQTAAAATAKDVAVPAKRKKSAVVAKPPAKRARCDAAKKKVQKEEEAVCSRTRTTTFYGNDRQWRAVKSWIDASRSQSRSPEHKPVLLIVGPPGIGKSSHVAALLRQKYTSADIVEINASEERTFAVIRPILVKTVFQKSVSCHQKDFSPLVLDEFDGCYEESVAQKVLGLYDDYEKQQTHHGPLVVIANNRQDKNVKHMIDSAAGKRRVLFVQMYTLTITSMLKIYDDFCAGKNDVLECGAEQRQRRQRLAAHSQEKKRAIVSTCDGDARALINMLHFMTFFCADRDNIGNTAASCQQKDLFEKNIFDSADEIFGMPLGLGSIKKLKIAEALHDCNSFMVEAMLFENYLPFLSKAVIISPSKKNNNNGALLREVSECATAFSDEDLLANFHCTSSATMQLPLSSFHCALFMSRVSHNAARHSGGGQRRLSAKMCGCRADDSGKSATKMQFSKLPQHVSQYNAAKRTRANFFHQKCSSGLTGFVARYFFGATAKEKQTLTKLIQTFVEKEEIARHDFVGFLTKKNFQLRHATEHQKKQLVSKLVFIDDDDETIK